MSVTTVASSLPKAKKRKPKKQNLTKEVDRLFSLLIRTVGKCQSGRSARHGGVLQCAHGISRRYRAVRWDRRNAFCFCQACHMYFTHHPLEWELWLEETWGRPLYEEMRSLALGGVLPDLSELVVELRSQAKAAA